MEGILILAATLVVFLAIGTWVLIKALKGPKLPGGYKFTHKFAGNKAIVIVGKDITSLKDQENKKVNAFLVEGSKYMASELAEKCAAAIHATEQAFKQKEIKKADVNQVAFIFKSDEEFEKGDTWWTNWSKGVAAYSINKSGMLGIKKIYCAVIRSKHIKTVSERGQPAIHEMVHILNNDAGEGYNHNHSDPKLWNKHGSDTVEAISARNWSDLINNS